MADILIVDDWPINREYLATLLRYAGHSVREAADGAAAFRDVERQRPDLVVTDVLMPVMDGTELARRLAGDKRFAGVPVIFYTAAYRLTEAQTVAAACGVQTVIGKPSEPQHIVDAIHGELGLPRLDLRSSAGESPAVVEEAPTHHLQRSYLQELGGQRAAMLSSVRDLLPPLDGDSERWRELTAHVDDSFLLAQKLSMRLATLIELGVELSHRDTPLDMLLVFNRAARDVLSARFAVTCVLDENGSVVELVTAGFGSNRDSELHKRLIATAGVLGDLLRDGQTRALHPAPPSAVLGLPSDFPRFQSVLASRIATRGRTFGWFYVADRLVEPAFDRDDQQIADILAAQLATHYENHVLFDRTRRNAGLLEFEIEERRNAMSRLEESELRFRQLAENIREVFYLLDARTRAVLYISPAYRDIWDRDPDELKTSPSSWFDAIHPEDRTRARFTEAESYATSAFSNEFRILRPDNSIRWIRSRGFPILDSSGHPYRIAGLAEDITEAKVQQLRITRLSRILTVLSSINSMIVRTRDRNVVLDEACRIAFEQGGFPVVWIALTDAKNVMRVAASRGVDEFTAAATEEFARSGEYLRWGPAKQARDAREILVFRDLRESSPEVLGPVSRAAIELGCSAFASLPLIVDDVLVGTVLLYAKDPQIFDDEELALLRELAGDVSFALQFIQREERLDYLAYYDALTGLPNATLIRERLVQMIEMTPRRAALFMLDLDRFRQLNESFGRHSGDRLLAEVARRLVGAVPEANLLGRFGADAFVFASSRLGSSSEAVATVQDHVLAALRAPFLVDETEVRLNARVGVAVYPSDGRDADTLLNNAEAALSGAKQANARFLFYSPELNASVAEDLALEQQLAGAMDRGELRVYYQPKLDAKSGELVGLEALLRWQRSDGRMVPPDKFIRLLEATELITDVGLWVIEQSLRDCRSWRERGFSVPRIAVNVSPIQLRYPDFPDMVFGVLRRNGFDGSPLDLEITESVIMADIDATTAQLERLHAFGVRIAIDDFGTGYSSLRYLAQLPVDTLKIDRSFVAKITTEPDSMTLVSTMINLAHSFDLEVVAEGVETEEQANLLRLMKCDVLQGYLISKPILAERIEAAFLNV